jgi:CDP-paratose 2-epimerase
VLVTGGAGFVGSNLAVWYKQRHPAARVLALDNLKRRGAELTLPRLRAAGVEFVHGDIRQPEDLRLAGPPVELVLECSAEPSVLAGYADAPDYLLQTNLVGTLHCLELARRTGADLVFFSTSRVYPVAALSRLALVEQETRFALVEEQAVPGASARGIAEEFPLAGARSLYGATKLCAELLIEEYRAMYGLRALINRCGVLTGPWQMGKPDQGVFALWVARHHFGRPLSYIGWGGTGKQVRDLLHIDDLAELLERELARFDALDGALFNVGGGLAGSLSLQETTALCQELTGHEVPIAAVDVNRPADLALYLSDCARVTQATGWTPRRSPRQTLADIHQWIVDQAALVEHLWLS